MMNALTSTMGLMKRGDWLVLFAGLTAVGWLFAALWHGSGADRVIIRSGGRVFAEAPLGKDRSFRVPGPLGMSLVTIESHRARVAQDPSPRQYCVKQGWLSRVGEVAVCLPNQVSVELAGAEKLYDSLNY